ncbi:hypothetical protein TruAng_012134 [Truncatella angustata]|nr:hypothetical protein TruAng_012134 [Truncatella angustata]
MGFKPRSALNVIAKKKGTKVSSEALNVLRADYGAEAAILADLANEYAKERYNKRHKPVTFEVGDTVYLKLSKGYHLPGKPKAKWSPKRAGPFKVEKVIGQQVYKLNFPDA